MAKIRSGILGNIRGKVAGVVGGQWKDVNYLREYVKPANPNTASQQVQRTKMSDAVSFCKPLVGPVFNAYTDKFQKSMSGFNFFIKSNISIFDGTPDFGAIKLTQGKLQNLGTNTAVYDTAQTKCDIAFSTALGNNGKADDAVFAAIFDESTSIWYFPDAEAARADGTIEITVPAGLTATDLECYVWAIQYDGTIVDLISSTKHGQATAA